MSSESGDRHPYHVDAIGVPVLIVLFIVMGAIVYAVYRDSQKRHKQFLMDRLDSQLGDSDLVSAGAPRAAASASGNNAPVGKLFKFA